MSSGIVSCVKINSVIVVTLITPIFCVVVKIL